MYIIWHKHIGPELKAVFGASIVYRVHEEPTGAFASQGFALLVARKREFVRMVLYIITAAELAKALVSFHSPRIIEKTPPNKFEGGTPPEGSCSGLAMVPPVLRVVAEDWQWLHPFSVDGYNPPP
jgi:hypothetical protein